MSTQPNPEVVVQELLAGEGVGLVAAKSLASLASSVGALHIIGGGQLARANQSERAIGLLLARIRIGKLTRGRVIALGLGIDRLGNGRLRSLWRSILKSCDAVYVRDQLSFDNAVALGVDPVLAGDLVFLLDDLLPPQREARDTIVVAPCIDAGEQRGINSLHVAMLIAVAKRRWPDARIGFALHDQKLDTPAMHKILRATQLIPEEIIASGRPVEFSALYARSLLTITNRLHSIIFSLLARAPIVCLNDGGKVGAATKEMELASLDASEAANESMCEYLVNRAVETAGDSLARQRQRADLNRVGLTNVLRTG